MSKKYIITNITNVDPTVSDNIAAGYALAQDWFNETTGERFYHKADGVWVSYSATGTNTEAPIMFADVATTMEFPSVYDNVVGGVGATLTSTTNGSIDIDGVTLNLDVVVLVKDQFYTGDPGDPDNRPQNGVYKVTQEGTPTLPVILTRVDFADETGELYPSQVNILEGIVNINKIFLQKTVDPTLGTDAVLYEANLIPITPQQILPVIFVDTATTEPLPSCTYANIYPTPVPGMWTIPYPSSATITANANGPLGTINGVVMGNSFANRNNRILVKNQANPVHNGDYQLIQAGSATTPWVLQRITTTGGSMVKSAREWKVNNENSTLYGTRYNLVSSSSIAIKIGISNLNYSEVTNTASIIEVTYAELVALKTGSLLIPGQTYLLTDYETTWNDLSTGDPFSSGVIEPLYITATDVNELSKECKSELYPQDIVYYEVTGDIDNGEGTEGFTKGKIYRRIDTIANNDIGTDWRHITYRRYAMKVENPWTVGNSYGIGDIVDAYGNIYICIDTIADSQSLTDGNWFLYPASNGEYAGRSTSGNYHLVLGNSIYVSIDINDHQDYYLFDFVNYYTPEYIYNNTIESYALSNTVITSPYFYENNIGSYFNNNHITSNQFNANEFARGFSNNLIYSSTYYYNDSSIAAFTQNICTGNDFRVNTFSNEIYGNVFTNDFSGNEMSRVASNYFTSFNDNVMSNSFNNNTLKSSWGRNTCTTGYITYCKSSGGDGVANNLFTGSFDTNIIKSDFTYNRLSGYVYDNTFNGVFTGNENLSGEEFDGNTFLGGAARNKIGSSFNTNTVGAYFSNNEIGSAFFNNIVGESFQHNNIKAGNSNWTFRNNIKHLTILNEIDGSGRNIPYIPGTYDKTIRLSKGVLKCDYVDEYSDIIFQPDNTGPTFTFKSGQEQFNIELENKTFSSGFPNCITIIDWGDVVNQSVAEINALSMSINHVYSGKLSTDEIEVVVVGEYLKSIIIPSLSNITYFDYKENSNILSYLEELVITGHDLASFNTTSVLPASLKFLLLYGNQLTSFDPINALPSSLFELNLYNNLLTSFDPSNALPNGLQYLYLQANQLTSFNPSISLPSLLTTLDLSNNQLTTFDPTIALPNSLLQFDLSANQLTSFNPVNHPLPSSLVVLSISSNQLDTTEVNNTLIMLNTMYTTLGFKQFNLYMSPPAAPDGAGLAAKTQLQAKGYTVNTN